MRRNSIAQLIVRNRTYTVVRSAFYIAVVALALSLLEFRTGLVVSAIVICIYLAGTARALYRIESAHPVEKSDRSLESFLDDRRLDSKRQLTLARAGCAVWFVVTVATGLIERSRLRPVDYGGLSIVACALGAIAVYTHLRLKQHRSHTGEPER
jgi:hypothetical protein